MPQDIDIESGYTLRVANLDVNGAAVSGVKVGTMVITATLIDVTPGSGGDLGGNWFLVPGPGA